MKARNPSKEQNRVPRRLRAMPRWTWCAWASVALCLTGHVANRQQQCEFGVDDFDVAHARSLDPRAGVSARAAAALKKVIETVGDC
jgi:hypothetical protein